MGNAESYAGKAGAFLGLMAFCSISLWAGEAQSQAPDCPEPEQWRQEELNLRFDRARHLSGFTTPLRSSGRVWREDETVFWQTETPIAMLMRIDEDGISQSMDGGPMEPLQTPDRLGLLLGALIAGDLAAISEEFDIERARDDTTGIWQVNLAPRDPSLARMIDQIAFSGCSHLEELRVQQANGDVDDILFAVIEP